MKAQNILGLIGNTPHVRVNKLFPANIEVWTKLERANPGGSIKDRIALSMVEDAERKGILKEGIIGVLKIQWQSMFKNYRKKVGTKVLSSVQAVGVTSNL